MSGDSSPAGFHSLGELPELARAAMSPEIRHYVDGASGAGNTLRANLEAFRSSTVRTRALSGVTRVDLGTELLGQPYELPFFVAPMAYQGSIHPDGESATATAAADRSVLAVFSTLSSLSLEGIAAAAPNGPRWFQLYLQEDPAIHRGLVERAERAGYRAIVLTVDVPVLGIRDGQLRTGFALDRVPAIGNGPGVKTPERAADFRSREFRLRADAVHGWEILDRLREYTRLPVIVKGILTGEDARQAVEHGARAVVVSNHGGRQLDGTAASLDALPEVVEAVGDRAEVYLDGGVGRGADVAVALASGARAVGIGRPILWALAVGGRAGVSRYLELLREELAVTLALMGRGSVRELDASALGKRRASPWFD